MRNLVLLSTVAAVFALTSFNAKATTDVTANGEAKVKIVKAVAMEHDNSAALDFGTAMAAIDHTITINPETGAQTQSDLGQIVTAGSRDHFTVTVPANMTLTITLPANLAISDKLNVTSFTSYPASSISATAAGPNDIYVGGTLAVTAGAAVDDYSEAYTLTVSY